MSSGYYLTPAFYYINLGAHTLYILRNRLEAQNVKKNKCIIFLKYFRNKNSWRYMSGNFQIKLYSKFARTPGSIQHNDA
jgi:hypothetical protein